ncbi:glycosyltransferase family 4 protein [Myroides odoratimimus]|uniref:glycosyltransferase family 4 protein n=1 Tax=Myroides odoratimimus TaxID=76832 RepID=UPI0025775931|nr:glycosyltransferase family 4 protein [Myroides odoratimimus]MDM1466513.1 glycosyltransferase family 4 protein [Myroides odoratimimus]
MRILIDNSNLFAGGGIQVATSFIIDLQFIKDNNEYHVIQSENSSKQIDTSLFDERFVFYSLSKECNTSIRSRSNEVKNIENLIKPNVIFTVFGPSYHKSNFPKVVGFAIPHIIYPKSPFFSTLTWLGKKKIELISMIKSYFFKKNSDALIFESDDGREVYSRRIGNTVPCYTVSNTVNTIFLSPELWAEISITKSEFDILYLTANYAHKNLNIIPQVIDHLLNNSELKNFRFHLSVNKDEVLFEDKYDKYINYLGKVDIKQVPMLYEKMDVLFMPTLLEVFSTSYLEAMISNIPIVASDMSFARDVCNDSAFYANPMDASDYALKIVQLYQDRDLYDNLVEKGKVNLQRFGTSMDRTKQYLYILKKYAI